MVTAGLVLLVVATIGWGLNMGVTTNLARAIVQESAQEAYRGRILSAFSVGMLGSAPIGAILLGWLTEEYGTSDFGASDVCIVFLVFVWCSLYECMALSELSLARFNAFTVNEVRID